MPRQWACSCGRSGFVRPGRTHCPCGTPLRVDTRGAAIAPDADARIVECSRFIRELAGPGADFFVAIAFRDRPAVSSMANMPEARQVEFLRYLLGNFERNEVVRDAPVVMEPAELSTRLQLELECAIAADGSPVFYVRQPGGWSLGGDPSTVTTRVRALLAELEQRARQRGNA